MLAKRLKSLRQKKKLTEQELADKLQINRSTYARYEMSATQPDFATLGSLADYFDVTTDYLLGRVDKQLSLYCEVLKDISDSVLERNIELIEKRLFTSFDGNSDEKLERKFLKIILLLYQVEMKSRQEEKELALVGSY